MEDRRQRIQALRLAEGAEQFAQAVPGSEWVCRLLSGVLRAVADGLGAGLPVVTAWRAVVDGARAGVAEAVRRHEADRDELPPVLLDMTELDGESEPTRRTRRPPEWSQ